ncbi:DUF1365 domain-containing protein [Pseudoduganella violaceinigra]|uniref:DUF1365 domain-containing protein n=1 Tax=Pseudoduganella violaceinigra TaxID=246602 RepID=UPI00068719BA|nr:DUF1365 domain-containing protein [Pseudoduganella violaceinigra]
MSGRPAPMQLVQGHVVHDRLRPTRNRFSYPVFYLRLNLGRLDECTSAWFGVDKRRIASIRTSDYGPRDGTSLDAWMRRLLREHGIGADGEIWLQTFPRIAGFVFNPVNFWHCYDAQGSLKAVLAEVNNTFGDSHCYLLRPDSRDGQASCLKRLHVSPFCQVEGEYRFQFRLGADRHLTKIDYHDASGLLLETAIAGKPEPCSGRTLLGALVKQPLLCIGIVARIHWQALRLWCKGVPFFGKNGNKHRNQQEETWQ